MEPFVNKPFVTIPVAQFDGTQFRFALRAYDPYETPFRTLEHRPLGYQDRLGPNRTKQASAYKLAGTQIVLRVWHFSSHQVGPRIATKGQIGKRESTLLWMDPAVSQHDLHIESIVQWTTRRPALPSSCRRNHWFSDTLNFTQIGSIAAT